MIKIFRKIRYNLMNENRTGKYLKYAIGEIILVVIGILIALQINNWNENRKNTISEYKLVDKMIGQAKADSLLFDYRIEGTMLIDSIFGHYVAMNQDSTNTYIKINYSGKLSPFVNLNDGSNLIRNHSEDFKQISNLELREELMQYAYLVTMMDGATELLNKNLQDYIIPLELEYFEALKPYDSTSTLEEMKAIFKNPKLEARFELIRGLSINVKNQIEILQNKNHSVLKDLTNHRKNLN
ncbi:DUF6090 family protein [Winogradskyella maritima]|uniref:DUF6090 family protein n=1 Tax=Winogradskyella maritima TaxID=1517766 RepID=A0ABV8AKP9_9FLAO|nr:DUF6090 family protein [Winogradskyella maritima]